MHGVFVRVAAGAVMLTVATMGFLKLADLPGFASAVRAWTWTPRVAVPAVTILVPLVEVGVGAWWFITAGRARWRAGAACLSPIALFSIVYVGQWHGASAPPCGCFGILARRFREIESAKIMLWKNAIMSLVLAADVCLRLRAPRTPTPSGIAGRGPAGGAARGFTLIEVLAVIMVVGVVTALLAPSLGRVRDSGRKVVTLANLRTHAAVFAAYHTDYRDEYPSLTDAGATYSIIRCESAGFAVKALYFEASRYWHLALADQYYGGDWASRAKRTGWAPLGRWPATALNWGCSFVADAAYYNPETRLRPPTQLRTIRASEVVFPSAKALMAAHTPWARFRRVIGSTVDGRASEFMPGDLLGEHPTGDGPYYDYTDHFPADIPMMHTQNGVRGRDVR